MQCCCPGLCWVQLSLHRVYTRPTLCNMLRLQDDLRPAWTCAVLPDDFICKPVAQADMGLARDTTMMATANNLLRKHSNNMHACMHRDVFETRIFPIPAHSKSCAATHKPLNIYSFTSHSSERATHTAHGAILPLRASGTFFSQNPDEEVILVKH